MSDTTTATSEPVEHPLDSLHRLLVELVNRAPWHSEDQHQQMMELARSSEVALKADSIQDSPAVVPPAPVRPQPVSPAEVAAGAGFDYDKLAAAMVKAQATQARIAAEQMDQANAAVAANPGWTPPSAESAAPVEEHAAAEAVAQ